jgi:cyclopentanol dehydrogenase
VVIGDVLEDEGRRTEAEINESGGVCVFIRLDVTSEESWQAAVSEAVDRFGKLDILVNNAGIYRTHNVVETSSEEWDQVMDINAKGVFLGTKTAIPAMRDAGGGSIVNISSIWGMVGAEMSSPMYQASKGAVRLLTKTTALQYAADGIRANSVHPGPIATPLTEASRNDPERNRVMMERTPMGRYAEPIEVAYGVLYLASDESSYVTGSELAIDGGWTAQ